MNEFANIAVFLEEAAEKYPYRKAIVVPEGKTTAGRIAYAHLTFKQLNDEVNKAANAFIDLGIEREMRTIVLVAPGFDFFIIFFALLKIGAIPVVVDPGMGLDRMVTCFQSTNPKAMISIPKAHWLRVKYKKAFDAVNIFIATDKFRWKKTHTLRDIMHNQPKAFEIAPTLTSDTAAILFTTGSTGPARGAIYTHGNFVAQLEHIAKHLRLAGDEVDLSTFPLFALFYPAMGVTAVIPDMDPTKPAEVDPTKIIDAIENQGVTNMFASPALLKRVGEYGVGHNVKLPSLRRVISAGAPVPIKIIRDFASLMNDDAFIHTPYGATEAVPVADIQSSEIMASTAHLTAQGYGICVGYPINDIETKIITINDDPIAEWHPELEVPNWEIGEIVVKSGHVSPRYFNNPTHDALCKIADHTTALPSFWHRMGDLGWKDDQGRIWFCGRKQHRVNTYKGELYTVPCESLFNQHPKVFRSALVGIGGKRKLPVICIETYAKLSKKEKQTLEAELLQIAKSHDLTRFIRYFLFVDKFPVDIRHNSKIFREQLTELAAKSIKPKSKPPQANHGNPN